MAKKPKAWTGHLSLFLPEIEEAYRKRGSPVIKDVEADIFKLAEDIQDRREVAAVVLGAIADGRAPSAEEVLGSSLEAIFLGAVMRRVASVIERQIDPDTGVRKLIAGRDDDGREIWALTESELGDRFYEKRAQYSLGTIIDASFAHEVNGYGGAFEFFEGMIDAARQGLEAKLEKETA